MHPTPREARATASRSYPSGHATSGWYTACILTSLAPDRASAILARAADYGESRIVCRLHHASDVTAGRDLAAVLAAGCTRAPNFAPIGSAQERS